MTPLARSPLATLARLQAGNRRWTGLGRPRCTRAPVDARRLAVVVTCSDLAVDPETVFDLCAGELLVAQAPAAFVDDGVIATVDFGVRALGIGLVVVLGHEGCRVLDTGPAALPTTMIERLAVRAVADARACGESPVCACAREQARLLELRLSLPSDVIVRAAVLREGGAVELL